MKRIIALLAAVVYLTQSYIVIGHFSADMGEAQVISSKRTEITTVNTDNGFAVRKKLKENVDYIVIWNNRGTKKKSDDKLIRLIRIR